MARETKVVRKTKETDIQLSLNIDGTGKSEISTGVGFFDHMLEGFSKHGFFDLDVKVEGDLQVDAHHTVEDTGIVLGQAIAEAIGDKKGIKRYGSFILPMDDALVLCAVDLCGRPYFQVFNFLSTHTVNLSNSKLNFSCSKLFEILITNLFRSFSFQITTCLEHIGR